MSNKINEVSGVIISRSLLEEYGYDGDMPSDEEMQTIADELLEYWGESDGFRDALRSTMSNLYGIEEDWRMALTTHQRGIILRGICGSASLKDKQPQISDSNTVITCAQRLEIWDICSISCDAEAFGLKAEFGYDGATRITFTEKE